MAMQRTRLVVRTHGQGLIPITDMVAAKFAELKPAPKALGLLHLFVQHTSASLLIQENASPSAQRDLEGFITRLAPEGLDWYEHLDEGPDDTVSHMKSAITPTFLLLPVESGRILLGTWQGLFLWEHRESPRERVIILTLKT